MLTTANFARTGGTHRLAKKNRRLTIIVVPETTKRSYSFTFAPVWLAMVALLFVGMAGGFWFYQQEAQALRTELQTDLAELEELRKTNRIQQAHIEEMVVKAQTIQDRLQELETLEQQIKQLTDPSSGAPSRSGDAREMVANAAGRGGPQAAANRQENLPTLATLLPADVKQYILGRRDTLELDLKLANAARSPKETLSSAQVLNAAFNEQLKELEESKTALTQGKQEIADHLDYLAHRPVGMPVTGALVSDRFGWRWSPFGWGQQIHEGIDFASDYWTPIHATADGVVIHAGWKDGGYGYTVMIDHGYEFQTLYAHMVDWNVKNGQEIKRGEVIGWIGNTGLSTGPHLHYEVHVGGVPQDPAAYLE